MKNHEETFFFSCSVFEKEMKKKTKIESEWKLIS